MEEAKYKINDIAYLKDGTQVTIYGIKQSSFPIFQAKYDYMTQPFCMGDPYGTGRQEEVWENEVNLFPTKEEAKAYWISKFKD